MEGDGELRELDGAAEAEACQQHAPRPAQGRPDRRHKEAEGHEDEGVAGRWPHGRPAPAKRRCLADGAQGRRVRSVEPIEPLLGRIGVRHRQVTGDRDRGQPRADQPAGVEHEGDARQDLPRPEAPRHAAPRDEQRGDKGDGSDGEHRPPGAIWGSRWVHRAPPAVASTRPPVWCTRPEAHLHPHVMGATDYHGAWVNERGRMTTRREAAP